MKFDGDITLSGSAGNAAPIGALLFERDGSMSLVVLDKSDETEANSIRLVSGFFQYALGRDDWMGEYAEIVLPDPRKSKPKEDRKARLARSHLRLVKSDKLDIN